MVRSLPVWWCGLAILLGCPLVVVQASAQLGRIEGTIALAPRLSARKPRFRPYAEYGPGAIPRQSNPDTNELSHVVVYLDSLPGDAGNPPEPSGQPTLEQLNERFIPHVLPILRGAIVSFPNHDRVFHNVFSLSSARTFDLGRYPQGESKSLRFDKTGVVQVFCHIHSDMSAIILVLANPYFVVPTTVGHYAIDDLPAGEYRLVAWHERIDPIVRHIHVLPGHTTVVDLTIPLPTELDRP